LKVSGDWYPSSGAKGLEELLARCPDLDAVFACNDPMAAGALKAAHRRGFHVPEDLAVVGYDDVPEAAFYEPALTSVHQPLTEMGGQAVDLLHQMLEGDMHRLQPDLLEPKLVIRESSFRT
jgi:LacI family transcriptional regulator